MNVENLPLMRDELEERLEELQDLAQRCRRDMGLSRFVMASGVIIFIANALGLIGYPNATVGVLAAAGVLGGLVWLGANQSTERQTLDAIRRNRRDLARILDEMELGSIYPDDP
jgi:hypothetical protein